MPAGIAKTPIGGRTKEAPVAKSAERTSSGGKKFVQTRLPFKLLTPGGTSSSSAAAPSSSSSSSATTTVILDEEEPAPRKRKLSYGEEAPLEELRRSNSKENLDLASSKATKKVKTTDSLAEDVIELDDDDEDEAAAPVDEAMEEVVKTKPKKMEPKKASPAPPIQIKLPLVNKRSKRRKSLKKSEESLDTSAKEATKEAASESSDDIEALAEELNPQKKQKVQKAAEKSPQKSPESKKTEEEEQEFTQKGEKESKKQEEPKKTTRESKKEETKATEPQKKNDQSTIDLFIAKKVEKQDSQPKEAPQKDAIKAQGKPKKAEPKAAEKSRKEDPKSQPQKEKEEKDSASKKKPTEKKAEESPDPAEISVILSSSEDNSSSSEHEMDVDTDTVPKEALHHRKSLPAETSDVQKALTPKQQRLLEQRKKAREEKEQKLAEERRHKQLEKEQREQQKKQERDEKEQQRKLEKDQKEQQRKQEREEKERKRQAEVDTKNEEKRKRNEAKEEVQRKKDEERRKKEQEREEAEQKKKRAAESFTKFFVPKQIKSGGNVGGSLNTSYLEHEQSSCDSSKTSSQTLAFRPFQVKDDMLLAPIVRNSLAEEQRSQLDNLFRRRDEEDEDEEEEEDIVRRKPPNRAHLYLSELSSGRREPLKMQRDARLQRRTKDEEEEDEVQVIDDLSNAGLPIEEEQPKQLARMRAKYLQFADNRRPAYYGTWRKKSLSISARRPLAQDKLHFDYELDSDCEWEEEEPGESLSASEDEKERESEEESEEEYNEWYVPHGHLSDEELQNDGEMDEGHTREAQKAKLQVLQQEFAQEMKKQTKKIKPRLLGPVWLDENGNKSQLFPAIFAHTIDMYACWQLEEPLSLEPPPETEREDQPGEQPVQLHLDERLMQQLVRLTHGNRNSKMFLINEYLEYLKSQAANAAATVLPSKAVLREKFDELASWKTVEMGTPEAANPAASSAKKSKKPKKRLCWVVASEMLDKFQLPELPLQNQWDYTLTPKISEGGDAAQQQHEQSPPGEVEGAAAASPVVATPTTPVSGQETAAKGAKKRATLIMSVPRDQPIHTATKNKLISQFLRRQSDAASNSGQQKEKEKKPPVVAVSDDVVMLSD
ncbi:chromatin assembly factor 1 subunit A-B [Drosophila takahashii]|uniref:chromatin assembly factor 1 subunit A-B n=1 Tax=Drosophila takahashii TaxID=29030 RepID=UPI001CF91A9B|nr:chromatin assembly factor 1 subunit A-B [Drosophila takahashii]